MQDRVCMLCQVSGKVQGVWFRAGTQTQAQLLGLTGWARNLPDGRVEVLACGDRRSIEAMLGWLREGPELAEVSGVEHKEVPWQELGRFAIQ